MSVIIPQKTPSQQIADWATSGFQGQRPRGGIAFETGYAGGAVVGMVLDIVMGLPIVGDIIVGGQMGCTTTRAKSAFQKMGQGGSMDEAALVEMVAKIITKVQSQAQAASKPPKVPTKIEAVEDPLKDLVPA